ncbi:MAG TPA: hypothetical protein VIO60_03355 [Rectinemataceae bacterium]
MRRIRFWVLSFISLIFLLGLAWQTSRFADLRARAKELEREQESLVSGNRRLEAELARLSNRERTSSLAERIGLRKALPEERLKVVIPSLQDSGTAGAEGGSGE